eukprot:179535-Hanusia_phi.AAC.2
MSNREGDLPNRNPYNPDPSSFAPKGVLVRLCVIVPDAEKPPERNDQDRIILAQLLNGNELKGRAVPSPRKGTKDEYDSWVATFDQMLERKIRWERCSPLRALAWRYLGDILMLELDRKPPQPADSNETQQYLVRWEQLTSSYETTSGLYDMIRNCVIDRYGQAAVPLVGDAESRSGKEDVVTS